MFYFWFGILLCSSNNGMSNLKFPLSIMSVFDQFTSRLNLITSSYFYFTNFQLFFSKSKLRRSTVRVSIFYVNLFRQQAAFHRSLALSYSGLHFLGCQASFHQVILAIYWGYIKFHQNHLFLNLGHFQCRRVTGFVHSSFNWESLGVPQA